MKTNRFAILVLSLSLIAGMLWAAGDAEESSAGTDEPFRIAVIMPSATTDTAFSQSMWQALKSVQADMGGESAVELVYSENMFKVPDAAAAVRDYAGQGYNLIVAHGSQYGSFVEEIAPDFPETAFAWGHRCEHLRPAQRLRLHGCGRTGRLRERRDGRSAHQNR
jgi:basic membrane lipoprotein Med (substrate-binding protein (PBP1-ABC) superfamily)